MEYVCKGCGDKDHAKNMDDILKYRKLCGSCLSKENSLSLKRRPGKKKVVKVKRTDFVYSCNVCGAIHRIKPYMCGE